MSYVLELEVMDAVPEDTRYHSFRSQICMSLMSFWVC